MKFAILIAALFVSACDPGVIVQFLVSAAGDDSTAHKSTQIANALAQRHSLGARPLDSSCDLASFHSESSPTRWWDFCVDQRGQSVSFVLEEWITMDWSPKGHSLRRELEDTLLARFGDRVMRID
jgi:hypothetical protein